MSSIPGRIKRVRGKNPSSHLWECKRKQMYTEISAPNGLAVAKKLRKYGDRSFEAFKVALSS